MKEMLNNFLEKYFQYKPHTLDDYDVHNDKFLIDKRVNPDTATEQIYDPNFGWEKGRKVRKALATPEEIFSSQIPNQMRDYCAHHFIRLEACRRDKLLSFFGCLHYREELAHCQVQDAILMQKEFERERRLMNRNKRIKRMEVGLAS